MGRTINKPCTLNQQNTVFTMIALFRKHPYIVYPCTLQIHGFTFTSCMRPVLSPREYGQRRVCNSKHPVSSTLNFKKIQYTFFLITLSGQP